MISLSVWTMLFPANLTDLIAIVFISAVPTKSWMRVVPVGGPTLTSSLSTNDPENPVSNMQEIFLPFTSTSTIIAFSPTRNGTSIGSARVTAAIPRSRAVVILLFFPVIRHQDARLSGANPTSHHTSGYNRTLRDGPCYARPGEGHAL